MIQNRVSEGKKSALKAMKEMRASLPEAETVEVEGKQIDTQKAFLVYCQFCGDIEKTAHGLGITPVEALRLCDQGDWVHRLEPVLKLKKSERPGDIERGISRVMNFVQAHTMRVFLDRLIQKFSLMSAEELMSYCIQEIVTTRKDGSTTVEKKITTRPFADLATAMEKVQMLTYYALSDSTTERTRKGDHESGVTNQEIHTAIAEAMAKVGKGQQSLRAQLFEKQLQEGAERKQLEEGKRAPSEPAPGIVPTAPTNT